MIKWIRIPAETKKRAYVQIAEQTGMSAFAVEKDWWVVQTLSIIFNTEAAPHLVFKGGTSLSKGWRLINRLSEDVDLAINRGFFGFSDSFHKPKTINPIPNPELIEAWRKDYNNMTEMIYEEDATPFEHIIEELYLLKERINALPWELTRNYPMKS